MVRRGHLPGTPWRRPGPDDWPPGWHVRYVEETESTNVDLLAVAGTAADRTVLAAGHQTAGRGRLDRRWEAPAGVNLLVSILFREVPEPPGEVVRRVALAAVDAAAEVAGVDVRLKWPNDLLVAEAKLAGILAQRTTSGEIVVGLGLNVGWAPDGAARLGDGVAVTDLLAAILSAYDRLPDDVDAVYRERLETLGRRVRVELPNGTIVAGTAVDVEPDGRLVVIDECAVSHRLEAGDVVHVRPA